MKKNFGTRLLSIVGPTASGKTDLALRLAKRLEAEIISCDSRGIYKGLPHLTAAPKGQWTGGVYTTNKGIPYHFVDFLEPTKRYNAYTYAQAARALIAKTLERKRFTIVTGGSGFYYRSLIHGLNALPGANQKIRKHLESDVKMRGLSFLVQKLKLLDPNICKRLDTKNPRRVIRALELCLMLKTPLSRYLQTQSASNGFPYPYKSFLVVWPKEILAARITKRVSQGFDARVKELLKLKTKYGSQTPRLPAFEALMAKPIWKFINGQISKKEAELLCARNDLNYAKRQRTWFKKEKNLIPIKADSRHFLKKATSAILKSVIN